MPYGTMDQPYQGYDFGAMPKMPSLQELLGTDNPAGRLSNVKKILSAQQPQMAGILPGLRDLLLGAQAPAVAAIREGSRANVAATQSDMMRRGLTGSDIEASAMAGARGMGEQQVGQLIAQQSNALAQYLMQALGLDIAGNREQFTALAQVLSDEFTAEQEADMFRRSLEEGTAMAGRANRTQLVGAGIGAVGSILGGFARR